MFSETAIDVAELGKVYTIYRRPEDRLKQMIFRKRRFFEEYWALQGVSFRVGRGETVGIIGSNGSGKSTLLQMICGTLAPSVGKVEAHGRIAALLELGAGFNPEFTGRENVVLAATLLGLSDADIAERLEKILEFAGVGEFIDQPVKLYSSGMYARLAFAVAAHVDADILVVDEILAVGDAAFTQKCMRFIRQFRQRGTLLFVSHDAASVINLCDRVVWLDRGKLKADGPAKEVCQAYHAALARELDDGSAFRIGGTRAAPPPVKLVEDVRGAAVLGTHKGAVEVFSFNPNAEWHGRRGATIERASLTDLSGGAFGYLSGGEQVALEVVCRAHQEVASPIVGFFVRDRLGQELFGDNTHLVRLDAPLSMQPGEACRATFRFQMPFLPTGDYSVVAAIAEGSQGVHVQHHWLNDALFFRVHSSHVVRGLIGLPMLSIDLEADDQIGVFS